MTSQSPEDDELCALIFPEAGKTTFPEMTSKDEFCGIAAFLTKNRSLDPVPSGSILTETLIEALPVFEHNNPIITFLLVEVKIVVRVASDKLAPLNKKLFAICFMRPLCHQLQYIHL